VVSSYQEEHDTDPMEIAAALTYLVQKSRPLKPIVKHIQERPARRDRDKDRNGRDRDRDRNGRDRERSPRRERKDRGERSNPRGERERSPRRDNNKSRRPADGMVTYRVEVGKSHGAEAKNIVGAIANEAGIDSQYIGRIQINDDHSTVDMPDGMPKDLFQQLRRVRVKEQALNISLQTSTSDDNFRPPHPHRRGDKPRGDNKG
jgi:ATP-dependent RNA helicase DeaD